MKKFKAGGEWLSQSSAVGKTLWSGIANPGYLAFIICKIQGFQDKFYLILAIVQNFSYKFCAFFRIQVFASKFSITDYWWLILNCMSWKYLFGRPKYLQCLVHYGK